VSQGKCPKTEVTGGIRDCAEYEFNRVDHRMDKDVSEFMRFGGLLHFL
jgi:hypothetical protein